MRRPGRGTALLLLTIALGPALAPASEARAQAPGQARSGSRPAATARPSTLDSAVLASAYARAAELPRLRSLLVSHDGRLVGERYFHGARRGSRANIKSASKSIISALVGIAIAERRIRGVHQPIRDFLSAQMSPPADPRVREITVEDLLTMRSGLETTSFENYGRWVTSRNWVRHALTRRMVAEPGAGGPMIYSTGSTHLLSAILTRATGMSTWQYANRKLGQPIGMSIPRWRTDPQGVYFGGNDMYLTPREMVAFGELYLRGGRAKGTGSAAGRQLIPRAWVDSSLVRRTRSGWSGQEYGYGWWLRTSGGYEVAFAWGYGGQFIFVVPDLRLVVVTTSDPDAHEGIRAPRRGTCAARLVHRAGRAHRGGLTPGIRATAAPLDSTAAAVHSPPHEFHVRRHRGGAGGDGKLGRLSSREARPAGARPRSLPPTPPLRLHAR